MAQGQKEVADQLNGVDHIELKRSQPSVEIKNDGKGKVSYTVKVYRDDVSDAVETAVEAAQELTLKLALGR